MKIRPFKKRFGSTAARLFAACGLLAGTLVVSDAKAQTSFLAPFGSPSSSSAKTATTAAEKSLTHGNETFRVTTAAGVRTAADVGSVATVGSLPTNELQGGVAQTACSSCGTGCGGSCGGHGGLFQSGQFASSGFGAGACSTGSCGNSYGGYNAQNSGFGGLAGCGIVCDPYCFVLVEGLYMEHQGDAPRTPGQTFQSGSFDFELGARITVGSVPDCVNGWEATYVGQFEWDLQTANPIPPGTTGIGYNTADPTLDAILSPFGNLVAEGQRYDAEYWSIEVNRTLVGWDVAKVLYGMRYIDYQEDYSYAFQNAAGATGSLASRAENHMFGAQLGLEMLYPVSCHGYVDFRGRAGAYLNFAESTVVGASFAPAPNPRSAILANDDEVELAGVFEIGSGYRYELGEMLTLRAGVELWYIAGLASAPDQMGTVLRRGVAQSVTMDEDIFVYGFNLGAQFKY